MTEDGQTSDCFADGPAVILGNAQSLFVQQLASTWKQRGLDVVIVTEPQCFPAAAIEGVRIINSHDYRRTGFRWLRAVNPALRFAERTLPRILRRRYQKKTGRRNPESWEWYWVDNYWDSFCRARAAMACRPAFVFGQEASSYGLATAMCKGVPRILFPWGGDIFNYVEASPAIDWMTTRALREVDLVVPSSVTAAEYIPHRFRVQQSRVVAVSWGVDLNLFQPASVDQRVDILKRYAISSDCRIVVNARRFKSMWGATEALEACMAITKKQPDVHCIFPGGAGTQAAIESASQRVVQAGLQRQFTFLADNISLSHYAGILSVADIFLSLLGRGDMRSSSVLQGAACGGVPVIVESPEYRAMEKQGFSARFVPENDPGSLAATIEQLLSSDSDRRSIGQANLEYVSAHEDHNRQMTHLLDLIAKEFARYRR